MSKFKIILKYYMKEKKLLVSFLTLGIMVTLFDLSSPIIVKEIIDVVMPDKDLDRLINLSLLVLCFYLSRAICLIFSASLGQLMGNKLKFYMRNDLIKHFLKQSENFFNKKNSGELISRITGDLENISTLLYRGLEDSLSTTLSLVGSFLLMIKFNKTLAFVTFIPLPLAIIFVYKINMRLKKGYLEVRKENGNFTSIMSDIFRVIFFIKDNSLEKVNENKFIKANENVLESEKKNFLNSAYLMSGIVFYSQFIQLLLIFVGGILYINSKMSLGIIFSFLLLVDRFKVSLMRFIGLIDLYQRGMVGILRFNEIMEIDTSLKEGSEDLNGQFESLEFKNVTFQYEEGKPILKNISFKILKGEKVAIGGQSGVGKTTIFNLIKRSYFPTSGEIYINEKNIKDIKRESLLKIIGVINKEENLFNTSIIENIKVVLPEETSQEMIQKAAEKACIHNKIMTFDKKYNTLLGINGVSLSNGEEQRISLARVFLKKAKLIMLDEATSGLDNIVENEIMENIQEVFREETVITITHKLTLLKNYDKIILIEDGEIKEEGNYKDLMDKKGRFYKILSI